VEEDGVVARGDHPRRTPVYGGALIVLAMLLGVLVMTGGVAWPGWLKAVLLVLALLVAIAGWLLTFRDLTPSRRR
jgi:UDP-N-acetylmuramyl pentapeptide phosphotransferase/UDP-N-acetylglucosamine-1-phosphate transferase